MIEQEHIGTVAMGDTEAPLEKALDAYWDAAYQQGQDGRYCDDMAGTAQKAEDDLRAAIAALSTRPAQEPVEWQRHVGAFGWQRVNVDDLDHYREKGVQLRALYAAPQPVLSQPEVKAETTAPKDFLGWQVRRPQDFLDKYPKASEFVMVIHETEREARIAGVPTKDMVNGDFTPERLAAVVIRPVYASAASAQAPRPLSDIPAQAGEGGWIKVPDEPTLEFLKSMNADNQVLAYENGRYYNAWFTFEQSEGGWFWTDDADSEPNPSHYRPLDTPPVNAMGNKTGGEL